LASCLRESRSLMASNRREAVAGPISAVKSTSSSSSRIDHRFPFSGKKVFPDGK
jgi:hypothetical protein